MNIPAQRKQFGTKLKIRGARSYFNREVSRMDANVESVSTVTILSPADLDGAGRVCVVRNGDALIGVRCGQRLRGAGSQHRCAAEQRAKNHFLKSLAGHHEFPFVRANVAARLRLTTRRLHMRNVDEHGASYWSSGMRCVAQPFTPPWCGQQPRREPQQEHVGDSVPSLHVST